VLVEGGDIQDELLDRLGGAFAPPEDLALTPSAEELEALALAVSARWPAGVVNSPAAAGGGAEVRRLRWASPRTRRIGSSAWRAGSVAAGIVLFSASAAAASGGVPLPRPVRVVAYSGGLPVDSPALDDTHQHIKDLHNAVKANDKPKAEATVRRLQTDLTKVPNDEKKEAAPKVEAAITAAANTGLIEPPAPTTTTTQPAPTTTVTAPAPSTTATTAEETDQKGKEKEKDRSTVTTTTEPTTETTAPEATTTTPAPETDGTEPGGTPGDPGPGDGHTAGGGGDPGTTPTTVPAETTTTTTAPPPETTTTTTTAPPAETTTTTTTAPPAAA
jgi:hypothetical protein